MFFPRARRCIYFAATLWVAMPPDPVVAAHHADVIAAERTAPDRGVRDPRLAAARSAGVVSDPSISDRARRIIAVSLGGFEIKSLSSGVAACGISWLTECNASGIADQAAAPAPPSDGEAGPSAALDVGNASSETGSCVDRSWNDCTSFDERPASQRISATVGTLIDRMIRDSMATATPASPLRLRTVGYHVPKGRIIILTSERRLLYFFRDDIAVEFAIGVARRNLQRLGSTVVTLKRRDPTWVPTALQRRVYRNLPASVGPGPKNPLGTRALNLAIPNIRIHGTNDDGTIDKSLSDGCFHMYNRDIEYLFEIVPVGTKVTILK